MSATQRRFQSSVVERLLAEPYRFEFFQAVRVLDIWLKTQGIEGDQAVADYVRFENSISLSFPPSEIESLRVETGGEDLPALATADLGTAPASAGPKRIYMTPAFMGFLGPNGTLPRHYSERVSSHQLYRRDAGPRAFLDTYSNRAVALFYGAWKKYRLELEYESKGKNGFLPLLMSLSGLGHPTLRDRLSSDDVGILDESLAYFAGALWHRPASSVHLQAILREYFQVNIEIEQFVGKFYPLPLEHQTILGCANAELGSSALVGQRVWQRDLRIALKIGPLRRKDFERFLPRETAARALEQMLKVFVGLTLEFEVQLILHADDVRGFELSEHRTTGRLGWDTFLSTKKQVQNRSDIRYTINPL
ncbi:MAG: type VI secretion system baseplate subunit TssG [Polaromonas sp.]|uniref:type VI secretion system baseplate subunit TssG n=1 Tax=Polaromonas sp. TaxID=1869339 RepID=UPI00181C2B3A|nr:type VI secretion system baseplate subunit TssG [Polaromonas sp.]NMM10515.1 type VI secretion system baseplate subunit TssG [Polaromonas sp.]